MRILGLDKKGLKEKAPMPVDFLQFIDAVVEVHGDPFYELRYRCVARCCRLRMKPRGPDI